MTEIEQSIKAIAQYVKEQIKDIRENAVSKDNLREEIAALRRDMLPRIETVHSKVKDIRTDFYPEDIEMKIEELERKVSELSRIRTRFEETDRKIDELQTTISEKALGRLTDDDTLIDAHSRRLNEMENKLEDLHKIVARSSEGVIVKKVKDEISGQFRDLKHEIEGRMKFIDEQLSQMKAAEEKYAKEITETTKELTEDEISDLREGYQSVRSEIEQTKSAMDYMNSSVEQLKNALESEHYEDLINEMEETRRLFDEESAIRTATDKKIAELEGKLKSLSDSLSNIRTFEQHDYKKLLDIVHREEAMTAHMENKIKTEALKVATNQVEEFARMMDRRIPNLATKEDLARFEQEFTGRFVEKAIREPTHIEGRISGLERRMMDIAKTLRVIETYTRQGSYYVVE